MNARDSLLFLLPPCCAIACSSSSSGSPSGGAPTFDAGGATFDAGADAAKESGAPQDAGRPDAPAGDTGDGIVRGNFSVSESTLVQTNSSDVFAGGQFAVYSSSDACPAPAVIPMGCTIDNCATQSKPQKYLSAGTVKVTGGNPPITMMQSSAGTYSFSQQTGEIEGSGMLTYAATGGDVPAFQVSIPQIGYISLTAPAQGATGTASRSTHTSTST